MATDALSTTKRVQIIDWKEFAEAALDPDEKVFMIHVATITSEMAIHPAHCFVEEKKCSRHCPGRIFGFCQSFFKKTCWGAAGTYRD